MRVPIDLQELYVPLRAVADLRAAGKAEFADSKDAAEQLGRASRELPLMEAFVEARRRKRRGIVILGEPGSGKTTHLRRLVLRCVRDQPRALGLPANALPVFLPLRDLRDLSLGLDAFIEAQLESPHLGMSEGFGARLRERGELLLLFDGLDEVADEKQRAEVARWVAEASLRWPGCTPVVTCRFAGYTAEARFDESFLELHISDLTKAQSEQFIRSWYEIVETNLAPDPEQGRAKAAARSQELIDRLGEPDFRAARLVELTRNPLLLTNMCLVHYDRGVLPRGRARLYSECVDVLLEAWRESKGLGTHAEERPGPSPPPTRRALDAPAGGAEPARARRSWLPSWRRPLPLCSGAKATPQPSCAGCATRAGC